jgi:hypothetical protein
MGEKKLLSNEEYFIVAMKNKVLYKMLVLVHLNGMQNKFTVSRLRIIRYPYKKKILTYAENEKTVTLSVVDTCLQNIGTLKTLLQGVPDNSAIDTLKVKLMPDSLASPLLLESSDGISEYGDSVEFQSLLPSDRVYEIQPKGTSYWYRETPWVNVEANRDGRKTLFALDSFKLISSGGNVRVKYYRKSNPNVIYDQTVAVFDRNILTVEAGPVYNMDFDGKPIGKVEYDIHSESLWSRSHSTAASMRLTSMRRPVVFDTVQKKNISEIAPIAEGELQLRFVPCGLEWKPSRFSFVGTLLFKTGPLNDTTDLRAYPGLGVGINISVPAFNEKQAGAKFGASSGHLTMQLVYDSYWPGARWRLLNDFGVNIFSLVSNNVTISLHGKADIPLQRPSQADVRLSIMSEVEIAKLEALLH